MRHTELSMLNHLYIIDPKAVRHPQFCSRIEIAPPEILLSDGSYTHPWLPFEGQLGAEWASMAVHRQHIFTNARTTPMWQAAKECAVTTDGIYDWLTRWWHQRFAVTYPLGTVDAPITYSYSQTFTQSQTPTQTQMQTSHTPLNLQAMVDAKAYSICNGLILALAMHRCGHWPDDVMHAALKRFVEDTLDPEAPWTFITPYDERWVPLYEGHIAQLTEYPCHYALCGAGPKVTRYMLRTSNDTEPVTQHIQASRTKYTTYQATAFSAAYVSGRTMSLQEYNELFEYTQWPVNPELYSLGDRTEPDWFGFARTCVGRRGFWRAWRARPQWRARVITSVCACSDAMRHALSLMLPSLFLLAEEAGMDGADGHLHPKRTHTPLQTPLRTPSRIRQLWRDVIHELNPEGDCIRAWTRAYLVRLWVTGAIGKSHPQEVVAWSLPPIAFMRDVLSGVTGVLTGVLTQAEVVAWLREPTTYTFLVRSSQCTLLTSIESRLGCKIEALPADPALPNRSFTIRVALYDVLKQLAESEPIMRVYLERVVQRPIVSKLTTVYKAFGMGACQNDSNQDQFTVGRIMLDYYKRQKEEGSCELFT
jgi:hypothetical protein